MRSNVARRKPLHVVAEFDLPALADSLGVGDGIRAGNTKCEYCADMVSFQNLYALYPRVDGEVGIVCDKPACIHRFLMAVQTRGIS
jgi:hypothetical protein